MEVHDIQAEEKGMEVVENANPSSSKDSTALVQSIFDDFPIEYFTAEFKALEATLLEYAGKEELESPAGIEDIISEKMKGRDRIDEALSVLVLEHYSDFVSGMANVMQIQKDLSGATTAVRHGRILLKDARNRIGETLKVASNARRKQNLITASETINRLNSLMKLRSRIEQILDAVPMKPVSKSEKEYAQRDAELLQGVRLIKAAQATAMDMTDLAVVQYLLTYFDDTLQEIFQRLDYRLPAVCESFDVQHYLKLLAPYSLAGETMQLADKILTQYNQLVLDITIRALKQHSDTDVPYGRGEGVFSELLETLPEEEVLPCVTQSAREIFRVLKSYHTMMAWNEAETRKLMSENASPRNDSEDPEETWESETNGYFDDAYEIDGEDVMYILAALQRGRKAVWDLVSGRMLNLIGAAQLAATGSESFLAMREIMYRFIGMGESFSGSEAPALRQRLGQESKIFISTLQNSSIQKLRRLTSLESWKELPEDAIKAFRLSQNERASVDHSASGSVEVASFSSFDEWVKSEQDPFRNRFEETSSPSPRSQAAQNGNENGKSSREIVTTSALALARMLERYVDMMREAPGTPGAVESLRGMMCLFEDYMLIVFRTFGQADALASETSAGVENVSESQAMLTPRLRATLLRITRDPMHQDAGPALVRKYSTSGESAESPRASGDYEPGPKLPISPGSKLRRAMSKPRRESENDTSTSTMDFANPTLTSMLSSGNLYGLKERAVATESLLWVADELRSVRSLIVSANLLPPDVLRNSGEVDHFFSRTVDAVDDLREHVYKTVAKLLLATPWLSERIAQVRWDIKELDMSSGNKYVNDLVSEFKQFSDKVSCTGVSDKVCEIVWGFAIEFVNERLVDGLSKVKKCTVEGRALMSLDLQVLISGIRSQAPNGKPPNMQLVDNYIKAFYMQDEGEILKWAQLHPEFTRSQIIALANLMAAAHGWKRKTKQDIVEKIERGEF